MTDGTELDGLFWAQQDPSVCSICFLKEPGQSGISQAEEHKMLTATPALLQLCSKWGKRLPQWGMETNVEGKDFVFRKVSGQIPGLHSSALRSQSLGSLQIPQASCFTIVEG